MMYFNSEEIFLSFIFFYGSFKCAVVSWLSPRKKFFWCLLVYFDLVFETPLNLFRQKVLPSNNPNDC